MRSGPRLGACRRCALPRRVGSRKGRKRLAFEAFDRALTEHDRTQMPFERARTLLLAGQSYRRYKQRARARNALMAAAELFDAMGARPWSARARAELGRLGRVGASADGLSETELRVAELAASGLSNQEVADARFSR